MPRTLDLTGGGGGVTLSDDNPASLGTTDPGVDTEASRSDHVHAHGNLAGGSLHAVASGAAAGFMSAADKSKLDGVAAGATANPEAAVVQQLIDIRSESSGAFVDAGTTIGGLPFVGFTPTNTTLALINGTGLRYNHATTPGSPPDGGSTTYGTMLSQLNACGHVRVQLGDIYDALGIGSHWDLYFRAYYSAITFHGTTNRVSMQVRGDADTSIANNANKVRGTDVIGSGRVSHRIDSGDGTTYSAAPASTVNVLGLYLPCGGIPLSTFGRWSEGDGTLEGVPVDFDILRNVVPQTQIAHRNMWLAFPFMSGTTSQNTFSATLQQILITARRRLPGLS